MASQNTGYTAWLSKSVQGAKSSAANAVNGAFGAVGSGVSGAGRGAGNAVSNSARGWADGLRSYGNSIKDKTGASGGRTATSSNPLGLAGTKGLPSQSGASKTATTTTTRGSAGDPLGLNR